MRTRAGWSTAVLGLVATVVAALAVLTAPTATAAATKTIRVAGYLPMADGTQLAYTVVRPDRPGPVPTLLEYSGYNPGRSPDEDHIKRFVEQDGGYAYVGLNLRGTGCSEGTFDFFQPQEALDGVAAIAWIRSQPWSDGLVGMIGKSYPGITQLFVAAQRPPGLAAIAPGHFFADAYRDVARPGGIANHGFATLWSFVGRPSYEVTDAPGEILGGDLGCLRGLTGEITGLPTNPYVQLLQHPFDDALFDERSPDTHLAALDIPMLATLSWQDEQLASRQTHLLTALDDLGYDQWWATLTNGDHGMARTATELADLERFYDHFLKGEDNGWDERPRVEVWWEAGRDEGRRAPGWVTGLDHWSAELRAAAGELDAYPLALRSGGRLSDAAATAGEPSSTYTYLPVLGTQGPTNPYYAYPQLPDVWLWDSPPPGGTSTAFTTDQLTEDLTVLGSASADLWIRSTAPDVDLQVTLTEVRPDGQEVFVQQGWLRASQRALDESRSSELLPYQTHEAADVAMLAPEEAVLARVEVFPFGHLFRAGSRLRVWVEAPVFLPQLWAFTPSPVPSTVTVLHDAGHPSRLVLSRVPNDPARIAELPRCGDVVRQPCRPDPLGAVAAAPAPAPPVEAPTSTVTTTTPGTGARTLPATGSGLPVAPGLLLVLVAGALVGRSMLRRSAPS